jgi:alanine dehydrogenase
MRTCIGLMEEALASLARGDVILPLRPTLRIPDSDNTYSLMPVYSKTLGAIGTKLITVFPGNHGTEYDSHQGAVVLIDGEHGSPLALMDAASITAIRTAAVSAVATRLLARRDARTLVLLGSGVQARTHMDAMLAVHPFERIVVWSRRPEHASAFVQERAVKTRARVEVGDSAEAAVRDGDVICTVTASNEPVLRGRWLRRGTHLNVVGSSLPNVREVDTDAVRMSRVFVDRIESAVNEAGDLIIPMREGAFSERDIAGEVGQILTGSISGRGADDEITMFKSLGLAIEDLASAHFLYGAAKGAKRGTWVDFG